MLNFLKRIWGGILTFLGWLGIIRQPEPTLLEATEPLPVIPEPQPIEDEKEVELPIKLEPEPELEREAPLPTPEEPLPEEAPPVELTPLNGKGMWIWRVVMAEDGNMVRIIERAKDSGLRWIAIKGGDGSSWWSQLTKTVVQELQHVGIKVFGWVYTYGSNPENEAAVAIHVLDLGCDGLIVDAEREYEGKPLVAESYMKIIRAAHPSAFIAYSTFPLLSLHPTFPYIEFGRYCDASMPQCYWKDIGLGPREMVRRTREEWNNWAKDLKSSGLERSVVPLFPVGQGYRVTGEEIAEFIEASTVFGGSSLWVWNEMTREAWDVLAGRPKRPEMPLHAISTKSKDVVENIAKAMELPSVGEQGSELSNIDEEKSGSSSNLKESGCETEMMEESMECEPIPPESLEELILEASYSQETVELDNELETGEGLEDPWTPEQLKAIESIYCCDEGLEIPTDKPDSCLDSAEDKRAYSESQGKENESLEAITENEASPHEQEQNLGEDRSLGGEDSLVIKLSEELDTEETLKESIPPREEERAVEPIDYYDVDPDLGDEHLMRT